MVSFMSPKNRPKSNTITISDKLNYTHHPQSAFNMILTALIKCFFPPSSRMYISRVCVVPVCIYILYKYTVYIVYEISIFRSFISFLKKKPKTGSTFGYVQHTTAISLPTADRHTLYMILALDNAKNTAETPTDNSVATGKKPRRPHQLFKKHSR